MSQNKGGEFVFYDNFLALCTQRAVTPSAVMRSIGLNKSSASYWKKGSIPSTETLQKLADYFGVSTSSLIPPEYPSLPDDLAEVFLNRDIGPNLKDLRKAKGLTQKELSEKTGIPLAYIQSFERGTGGYFPTEDDLLRLAEVFRVDPKYIKGRGVTQEWMQATIQENCYREMNDAMQKLNIVGQQKAVEYVRELAEIPRYRRQEAPQSPPDPQVGMDTTPATDAPETPENGE